MPPDDGKARAAIAAGVGSRAAHALPGLAQPVPAVRALLGIDSRTASGEGVALTFDDGPHPEGTAAVLETLRERGATATFFLVGEQVARAPALAAEVAAAGHGIALHCDRHRNLLRLTPRQVRDDLDRARDRIVSATGVVPRFTGRRTACTPARACVAVRRRGLRPLLWTHWGRDWSSARDRASRSSDEVTDGLLPGSVLLLHDGDAYASAGSWRSTAAALPEVLDRIAAAGLAPEAP